MLSIVTLTAFPSLLLFSQFIRAPTRIARRAPRTVPIGRRPPFFRAGDAVFQDYTCARVSSQKERPRRFGGFFSAYFRNFTQ